MVYLIFLKKGYFSSPYYKYTRKQTHILRLLELEMCHYTIFDMFLEYASGSVRMENFNHSKRKKITAFSTYAFLPLNYFKSDKDLKL